MITTTRTTNDEGVSTVAIGDESDGFDLTVIPSDESGPLRIEVEGFGAAAIDGGVRLTHELAAKLATELFTLLTDR